MLRPRRRCEPDYRPLTNWTRDFGAEAAGVLAHNQDGRELHAGTAIFDAAGKALARSRQLWLMARA
jgi:hypothetical protein